MAKDEQIKAMLLTAAREVFREYGPVKSTMADVARRAGVSKSLVYYYFKDKKELFQQVILQMDRHMQDELRGLINQEQTAAGRLRVLLTRRFEYLNRAAARRKVSLERSLEYYPFFHPLMELFWDNETGLLQEVIDFGVDRHEFCVADSYAWCRQMAMVLLALDHQVFMRASIPVVDMDAWAQVVDTLIKGLQCPD